MDCDLEPGGLLQHAFRKARAHGQPLMREERPGRDHVEKAGRPRDDPSIPGETSLRTGENADVVPNEPVEPVQAQFRAIDRPGPAIPGDVPVEAVLVRSETHLPPRQVADGVGVDAGGTSRLGSPMRMRTPFSNRDTCVGTASPSREASSRTKPVVERDPQGPAGARVVSREIAIDAVPDLRPQHPKADRLGYLEAAVGLQLHIAEEVENPLGLGIRGRRAEEQQRQRNPVGRYSSTESDLRCGARGLIAQLQIAYRGEAEPRGDQVAGKGLNARVHLARHPL